jgi:hypothetical protein
MGEQCCQSVNKPPAGMRSLVTSTDLAPVSTGIDTLSSGLPFVHRSEGLKDHWINSSATEGT